MKFSDEFIDSMGRCLHDWWDLEHNEYLREIWKKDIREALEQADKCYPLVERPTWKWSEIPWYHPWKLLRWGQK